MKFIFFATLLALAVAHPDSAPQYTAPAPPQNAYSAPRADSSEEVTVEKDERVSPGEGGAYSLDLELSDGTKITESGYGSGPDGAVETQGTVQFVHPDGEEYELSYVANAEGGYQPESSALPVAPAFPHPIPQFVLDQIAKAAIEDADASSEEVRSYA